MSPLSITDDYRGVICVMESHLR